jgi:hypothetical protein
MRPEKIIVTWALASALAALLFGLGYKTGYRIADDRCDGPVTCAECTTDEECDRLCGVGPCGECGQTGCWMPDNLKCEEMP